MEITVMKIVKIKVPSMEERVMNKSTLTTTTSSTTMETGPIADALEILLSELRKNSVEVSFPKAPKKPHTLKRSELNSAAAATTPVTTRMPSKRKIEFESGPAKKK